MTKTCIVMKTYNRLSTERSVEVAWAKSAAVCVGDWWHPGGAGRHQLLV